MLRYRKRRGFARLAGCARRQILGSLLAALTSLPLLAQGPLPPPHSFGRDTRRTGAFTGAGTPLGLTCAPTAAGIDCAGFLASEVDGTALDVTVRVPLPAATYPLVVNLHGYGGSKNSSSAWDDKLVARGYAVLRYSARGFGKSWGQVNLADLGVELGDLRSLLGQVVDAAPGLGLQLDGGAVAVLGASYGGGQSWLAALHPKFDTPGNNTVRIRTIVPIVPWTDLLGALRPNGDLTNSIDVPGSYKLSYLAGLFLGGLRRDRDRPYPNYPDYLFIWNAFILATEPNNLPPIGTQIVDGIAGYRSIWWQQQFFQAVDENASSSPVASSSNPLAPHRHRTSSPATWRHTSFPLPGSPPMPVLRLAPSSSPDSRWSRSTPARPRTVSSSTSGSMT